MLITRFSTYIIAASNVGTKALGSIDKVWPLSSDGKLVDKMDATRIENIKKRYKIRTNAS
jgi:hypothetical protein